MSVYGLLSCVVICATLLAGALMVLVSMPHSPIRDLMVRVCGWLFTLLCAVYFVSPVDVLPEAFLGPFGLPDDVAAVVAGFLSAGAAWRAGKTRSA